MLGRLIEQSEAFRAERERITAEARTAMSNAKKGNQNATKTTRPQLEGGLKYGQQLATLDGDVKTVVDESDPVFGNAVKNAIEIQEQRDIMRKQSVKSPTAKAKAELTTTEAMTCLDAYQNTSKGK